MILITDRTPSSVYGYTDLNRVEETVKGIGNACAELGISFAPQTKTDWAMPGDFTADEWPIKSQMARYLGNVAEITRLFHIAVPLPESMDRLTWVGANNIEKALDSALSRIEGIKSAYRYSGEIFAGEETI